MAGLNDYDCDGVLTIGGVSMNRPAWMVGADKDGEGGLLDLITFVEQRGEDRLLPNATGVIPYRRRATVTVHDLRILVVGEVDENGATVANPTAQLVLNLQYLMTNVVAPVGTSAGTRAATYDPPGGGTQLSADVHVTGLRKENYYLDSNGPLWVGKLQVSVPEAAFA